MSDEDYGRMLEAMSAMGRASRWYQRRLARGLGMDVIPGYETRLWNPVSARWELHKIGDESLTAMEPGEAEYNRKLDGLSPEVLG